MNSRADTNNTIWPLTWAVGSNGDMAHISEVERGLKCNCVCPMCRRALVAKQGKVREHHFAHAKGEECEHAGETALHLAAKDILATSREIVLPEVVVQFPHASQRRVIAQQRRYEIECVDVERKLGSTIPDVIVQIKGRKLLVEVAVTHKVDEEKLQNIREQGLSCVEIDLSDVQRDISRANLKKMVIDDISRKFWLHNVRAEEERKNTGVHVDRCPSPAKTRNGTRGKPWLPVGRFPHWVVKHPFLALGIAVPVGQNSIIGLNAESEEEAREFSWRWWGRPEPKEFHLAAMVVRKTEREEPGSGEYCRWVDGRWVDLPPLSADDDGRVDIISGVHE